LSRKTDDLALGRGRPLQRAIDLPGGVGRTWSQFRLVEVLDDLVRARPLLGRHHEIHVAASEAVERVIGGALSVQPEASQLIAPRERRRPLPRALHARDPEVPAADAASMRPRTSNGLARAALTLATR